MHKIVVLTPTKNREKFFELSKTCLLRQRIPVTWVIIDNSDEGNPGWSVAEGFEDEMIKVIYKRVPPAPLGKIRNLCIEEGLKINAQYYAWWDDDDYYMPQRFSKSIEALERNPSAQLVSCREMQVFLARENVIVKVGPYPENQGTCASYFVRRSYIEGNRFDDDATKAEETTFCRNWKTKAVSLDCRDVLLVVGHDRNTVDKSQVYEKQSQFMASVVNEDNAKNIVRFKWIQEPSVWNLFYKTHLSEYANL